MAHFQTAVGIVAVAAAAAINHGHWNRELQAGQVIPSVATRANPDVTYALYLPSNYTPARAWPVLIGFHYDAQGIAIVDKYREAAETYGYIVVASNESRNGSWAVSSRIAQIMTNDAGTRFEIDPARVYLTGLSGGARLSMQIAMSNRQIAGVIASSAGYPDSRPRASVGFPVFATVGTLDFNYMEMKTLASTLRTPHRLVIFEGGHVLPPDDVAMRAIEWMELRAMASGLKAKDAAFIDRLWQRREREIEATGDSVEALHALRSAVADFQTLRDVSAWAARADALAKRQDIRTALEQERRSDLAEAELMNAFIQYELGLIDPTSRAASLMSLRSMLSDLHHRASSPVDSPERRRARRVLEVVSYAPSLRVSDQEYLALLQRPLVR